MNSESLKVSRSLYHLQAHLDRRGVPSSACRSGATAVGAGCRQCYLLYASTFAFSPRGIFSGQLLNAEWKEFAIEA